MDEPQLNSFNAALWILGSKAGFCDAALCFLNEVGALLKTFQLSASVSIEPAGFLFEWGTM